MTQTSEIYFLILQHFCSLLFGGIIGPDSLLSNIYFQNKTLKKVLPKHIQYWKGIETILEVLPFSVKYEILKNAKEISKEQWWETEETFR